MNGYMQSGSTICREQRVHFNVFICFFFSSRRRHTRCLSDWSSDVCSSDLIAGEVRNHLRDASRLIASGWRLSTLDLLDLFPNTHHVETLASFERAGCMH